MTVMADEKTAAAPVVTGVLEIPGQSDITWNRDDDAQVHAACAAFSQTLAETKGAAYKTAPGSREDEVTREFDPEAERIRMFGQMQGG
jgi:hypothetical protein